jgi:hypothetical protein
MSASFPMLFEVAKPIHPVDAAVDRRHHQKTIGANFSAQQV